MEFRSTIQLNGKTATGIPVPREVVEGLNAGKRPKVLVTVGEHTYRELDRRLGRRLRRCPSPPSTARPRGSRRATAVDVTLELDAAPREVEVPPDFAKALKAEPKQS